MCYDVNCIDLMLTAKGIEMSIFKQHNVDHVLDVITDNVEWFFGDWDKDQGIGSSDVGACVRAVLRDLGTSLDVVDRVELSLIKNGIHNKMSEVLA